MPDWRGALTYPIRGPERERPFLVVWILLLLATALPFFRYVNAIGALGQLLLMIPVSGYLVRLLVATETGDSAPPFLTDPTALVRDGFGGLVVSFFYLAIPVILLAVTIYGAISTERVPDANSFSILTIYAGSTAVLCLSLVGAYLLPIGLASYGKTGSLRAAFPRADFRSIGINAAYFAGWVAAFGVFGFVTALAVGIVGASRLGPLVATALIAYTLLFTVHVWGRALARAQ